MKTDVLPSDGMLYSAATRRVAESYTKQKVTRAVIATHQSGGTAAPAHLSDNTYEARHLWDQIEQQIF